MTTNVNSEVRASEQLRPGVSVVVPVFNSEGSLSELVRRLIAVFTAEKKAFEIILVDDASRDKSWQVIQQLCAEHPEVRGFRLMRNYGQHNALLCGIRAARYDVIVTMDDDLQNPPEEVPVLLAALGEDCDVVYGTPEREQHGFFRDMASRITKLALQNAMGAETARHVSAFRTFRTTLRDAMQDVRGPFVCIDVLLTWGTTRFKAIPVRHDPRRIGRSNYTLSKLIVHALNMMTGFSVIPLQLASWLGFAFTIFGVGVLAFVIGRYLLQGSAVPGFAFLASIIALFAGVQLFALGIIGEYLARLYFRSMDKPSYAVRDRTKSV
jgi:glycosyltransferase involved in cell wall biosynthesis